MLSIRKGHFTLFLVVLLLNLSIISYPVKISLSDSLSSVSGSISQKYTVHDPIAITNDGELAAVANSGNGTANDPYIIAGWNITGSSSEGIYITGDNKTF